MLVGILRSGVIIIRVPALKRTARFIHSFGMVKSGVRDERCYVHVVDWSEQEWIGFPSVVD